MKFIYKVYAFNFIVKLLSFDMFPLFAAQIMMGIKKEKGLNMLHCDLSITDRLIKCAMLNQTKFDEFFFRAPLNRNLPLSFYMYFVVVKFI